MPDSLIQLGATVSRQGTASAKLTHGSLFTGVGGMDAGLEWAGFETAWQVEFNPFARDVLKKHWPNVPKFTDVRECGKHNLEPVDIITGGYPCQDHSIAGKKRGLGTPDNPTERSGLWFEYRRIIRELRPRWVLIENVSRLLRTADGDTVLSDMEGIGYSCQPLVVGADKLGAPHKRQRAWILCHDKAYDRCDSQAMTVGEWAFPPECQRKMEEARERWNYWKHELSGGPEHGYFPMTSTPTALQILEAQWPNDGRFHWAASGRARKQRKSGADSSMPWAQKMLARAVMQKNPKLIPTPEALEEFMGFPRGWTDLACEGPEAAAYARILRGVYGIPNWRDRLRALGNAVVPQIPMLFGCFIQQCESQIAFPVHAGIQESKEDILSRNSPAEDMPGHQTRENISRVETVYESLDVEETKKAFQELKAALDGLASTVAQTMEQIVPYLARMQSLLSQRGADRKKVLKKAGLPRWTQWAASYAKSLDCTVRTIQLHIRQLREGHEHVASGHAAAAEKRTKGSSGSKPVRLDARQQAALVKAQLATNDLVAALKHGADWQTPLADYEKVAVAPAKLDTFLNALNPEPDWKTVLANLVSVLEPCGDMLPIVAKNAMHAAQALLGCKASPDAACAGPTSPKLTACPPARNLEREGRERETPVHTYVPAAIANEGTVLHGTGRWGGIDTAGAGEAA